MQEERQNIYEGRVSSGRDTFFIQSKKAKNDHYYITVTDSRRQEDGTFTQQKIIVFEESVKSFREKIIEACKSIEDLYEDRREKEISEIRKTHPRAFMKWTDQEQEKLEKLFKKGGELEDLSKDFGRSPGSLLARLERMGLVQPAASGE